MIVEELFRRLSFGEFSGLSLGSDGAGEIKHEHQPKIIGFLNDALMDLYTRFVLSEKELIIEMREAMTSYHLTPEFSESNCDPCNKRFKFIKDCADPFENDLLKILSVRDGSGCELPLNDNGDACSVFTPRVDVLQVPNPVDGQMLSVMYQAKHRRIEYGARGQRFYVPPALEPAVPAFIANKVFSAMNGEEHTMKGQEYKAEYERICLTVMDRDSVNNTANATTSKFQQRGFV